MLVRASPRTAQNTTSNMEVGTGLASRHGGMDQLFEESDHAMELRTAVFLLYGRCSCSPKDYKDAKHALQKAFPRGEEVQQQSLKMASAATLAAFVILQACA